MKETDMDHPNRTFASQPASCPAHSLNPPQRQQLALDALTGAQPIAQLAQQADVSRKFVYQQKQKAQLALQTAFDTQDRDDDVLFYLPVTKAWIQQMVLALILLCHSSYRGVLELFRDFFDLSLSLGTIHNIVTNAARKAERLNEQVDLANVRIGANDEIFQHGQPVFTGVDVDSTYCYLLSLEETRDGQTWSERLKELKPRNFAPEAIVTDAGRGLCQGQQLALPQTQARGDLFHALKDLTELLGYLERRAYDRLAERDKLQRSGPKGQSDPDLPAKLSEALWREAKAIDLAEQVGLLIRWLKQDVLGVAGPSYADRWMLYQFLLEEFRRLQPECEHRIKPVATMLKNQAKRLLAFAQSLEEQFQSLSEEYSVSVELVRRLLGVQTLELTNPHRWPEECRLREWLGDRFYPLSLAVSELIRRTVRASSVVENLNGRLRSYFFLRRHVGSGYLPLVQFFLNHRRFQRSEHSQRVDKSPRELLEGQSHPHWLTMLGYEPFSRN